MPLFESWKKEDYVDRYNNIYGMVSDEVAVYLSHLKMNEKDSLVDFGCGDGTILVSAAGMVRQAMGVDCSVRQVELAKENSRNIPNVKIINGSFLGCDLTGYNFTKGCARKALHHLTDDEKSVFFSRISANFVPGSLFLIEDGIFDFDRSELEKKFPQIMEEAGPFYGERWELIKKDFIITLREEFPTGRKEWEKALSAGGFKVIERWQKTSFYGGLLAMKVS